MIRGLLISEYSPGIHFYTLNMEVATTQIAKNISLWLGMKKPLPFSLSADPDRTSKEVSEIKIKRRKQVSFSQGETYLGPGDPSLTSTALDTGTSSQRRWGRKDSPASGVLKACYLFYMANQSPKNELLTHLGRECL